MVESVRVKICGLTSVKDTIAAIDAGADAIGLNFVPGSPRRITPEQADQIRAAIPPFVMVIGVFADADMNEAEPLAERLCLHGVQLHGRETTKDVWPRMRDVIKAFRVVDRASLDSLTEWSDVASSVMLDGPGGGKTFDWSLVAFARDQTRLPMVLAGGLTPRNVAEAIRVTGIRSVDVASGVESTPGKKDETLMRAFIANAKGES